MSKSEREDPRTKAREPRRPEWREKLRRLIEEARAEVEAEEKAGRGRENPP